MQEAELKERKNMQEADAVADSLCSSVACWYLAKQPSAVTGIVRIYSFNLTERQSHNLK
jgi:hypothetical protein